MCGIVCAFDLKEKTDVLRPQLLSMSKKVRHRGPDWSGIYAEGNAILAYKKDKFSAKLIPHFFSAAADIYDGTNKLDNKLGTEIDFTVGYKIADNINLSAGYSKMFAEESLEFIKGATNPADNNSWGWIMFTFKPTLFTTN